MRFKRRLVAGFAAITGAAIAPIALAATPHNTVDFLCTNLVSHATWQISVDFQKRAVNSSPARISDSEISWHDKTDGGNYTLDRRSGNLTVIFASSTGGYFVHDRCTPEH